MGRERSRGECLDHLHRVFQERDAVAGVKANANVVVADPFQNGEEFVGAQVFVVLDGQTNVVSRDNGCGQAQGVGRRLNEPPECSGGCKRLVSPSREHDSPHDVRTGSLGGADLGLEPPQVGLIARKGDDSLQIHRGGQRSLAQGVGRGVVECPETDLNTAGAQRARVVEESGRL